MPSKRKPSPRNKDAFLAGVQNAKQLNLFNGLSDVLGFTPGGIGSQISQVDTLFRNNRWYLISNMRQPLSELYVEHGLVQTLVDLPVDDAMRGGFDIKSEELDEDQIKQLLTKYERGQFDQEIVGQAAKWSRLYGGSAAITMVDQDPATPLNVKAIRKDSPMEFRVADMWELFQDQQTVTGYERQGLRPDKTNDPRTEFYTYNGIKVHKSRVHIVKGTVAPSFVRPRLRGWGVSIVEALVASLNQYVKSNEMIFEVLDEFKVDVFRMKGLTQTLLSATGNAKIRERIALATSEKNFKSAITLDAEDEYVQKQLTFAGVAEMMREFRIQIASDMRIPLTKLFGISASGFNSGEDDIENYNAMVEGQVRAKTNRLTITILELMCQQLFGFIPTDLQIDRKSLRVLTTDQEEDIKAKQFNRIMAAFGRGLMSQKDAKEALNRAELLPIKLDPEEDTTKSPAQAPGANDANAGSDNGGKNGDKSQDDPADAGKKE